MTNSRNTVRPRTFILTIANRAIAIVFEVKRN